MHAMGAECLCGNDQAHSHSCPIVARKYVFARFKTLNDISDFAVEGGIVSKLFKIYNRYWDTSFCLQVPMSHKDGIPTLLSICPMAISIINMQLILLFSLFKLIGINNCARHRFSPSSPLSSLTSDLGTSNTV